MLQRAIPHEKVGDRLHTYLFKLTETFSQYSHPSAKGPRSGLRLRQAAFEMAAMDKPVGVIGLETLNS